MVKFIYSGRLKNLADKSDLLLVAADKYDIKDLKEICCQYLAANLNTEQVDFYFEKFSFVKNIGKGNKEILILSEIEENSLHHF